MSSRVSKFEWVRPNLEVLQESDGRLTLVPEGSHGNICTEWVSADPSDCYKVRRHR